MWTGIHALTDYKPANSTPSTSNATLPDVLNNFYARFDHGNTASPIKAVLTPEDLPLNMQFIDFSSTFNTVIPSKLISKLSDLGISSSLCNWTLDFHQRTTVC